MPLRGLILDLYTELVESRSALQQPLDFVSMHRLRSVVDQIFPLEQANKALDKMLSGTHFGKIGIQIAD